MKRILTIDKCQDCNIENCKLRTMCGTIPDECPLQKESEMHKTPSWDDAPEWANWLGFSDDGWCWFENKPICHRGDNTFHRYGVGSSLGVYLKTSECSIYSRPKSHKEVSE